MTALKKHDPRMTRVAEALGIKLCTDRDITRVVHNGVAIEVHAESAMRNGSINFDGLHLTPLSGAQWQVSLGKGQVALVENLASLPMCQAPEAARPLLVKLAAAGL